MLPPEFHSRSVVSRPVGEGDSVFCDGTQVLRLSERINGGGWFALNTQRPERVRWTTRECTSYSQGVAGAELWVVRHQGRLRAEIDRLRVARAAGKRATPK